MDGGQEHVAFGSELQDAFRPINSWVQNGISWLDDIQSFYRERSLIEREYSARLSALVKDATRKKAKANAAVSVGDSPTMTSGNLENSSMTTWGAILNSTESVAREHEKLGQEFATEISDTLKGIATRFEEFRKHHTKLAAKMLAERDNAYAEVKKFKSAYDYNAKECHSLKQKAEKHLDASNVKVEREYKNRLGELANAKNAYLISVNVANRHKEHFYHETLPDLMNSMQDLSETRTAKLNSIWTRAGQVESACAEKCLEHTQTIMEIVPKNLPVLDSIMFIQHNKSTFEEPVDYYFEASHVWRDTPDMATGEAAQIFLLNLLGKGKTGLIQVKEEVDKKRRDIESLQRTKEGVKLDESRAAQDMEVTRNLLNSWDDLVGLESRRITMEIEVETILDAVGDLTENARSHKFKATSFKIPTNCDLCNEKILGFGSKGFHCKDCGYSCHSKCEMKVPAECPGHLDKAQKKALKEEKRGSHVPPLTPTVVTPTDNATPSSPAELKSTTSNLSRSNTMTSLSSSYAAGGNPLLGSLRSPKLSRAQSTASRVSVQAAVEEKPPAAATPSFSGGAATRNRVIAPPPTQYVKPPPAELHGESAKPKGRMIYSYTAQDEGEISLTEGMEFTVLEGDDGGWTKVKYGNDEGVVPTSYMELLPAASTYSAPAETHRPSSSYSSSSASINTTTAATGKKKGPAVAPKRGAKKVTYVEAAYDYQARTDQEFSMTEGDRFVLIQRDTGDGWTDVELNGVTKSVPTSYIIEL